MTSSAFLSGGVPKTLWGSTLVRSQKRRKNVTHFIVSAYTASRNPPFHFSARHDLSASGPLPFYLATIAAVPEQLAQNGFVALFVCDLNRCFLGFVSGVACDGSH